MKVPVQFIQYFVCYLQDWEALYLPQLFECMLFRRTELLKDLFIFLFYFETV